MGFVGGAWVGGQIQVNLFGAVLVAVQDKGLELVVGSPAKVNVPEPFAIFGVIQELLFHGENLHLVLVGQEKKQRHEAAVRHGREISPITRKR